MKENKLQLNDSKTEVIIMIPDSYPCTETNVNSISVGECEVGLSSKAKNLGFIFDSTMQHKPQISNIVKTCHLQLRKIGKIRKYLRLSAAEKAVHAFISSRIDNGNSLLCNMPDTSIQRILTFLADMWCQEWLET